MLDVAALQEVQKALQPVLSKWNEIGIILGARHDFLQTLVKSGDDASECIKSVAKKWLKKKYDVKRFGVPSWMKLVEAIGARTGGNNSAHALEVAQRHMSSSEGCVGGGDAKRPCLQQPGIVIVS